MPRIEADFTQISSSFEALPAGEYQCVVKEIEHKDSKSQLPMVVFTLEVTDPNHTEQAGRVLTDYVVLRTSKGQPNKIGLGQIKAYAEAILGVDAANNPEGIDTDELKSGTVLAVVDLASFQAKDKDSGQLKTNADGTPLMMQSNEIKKILPVS